MSVSQHGWLRGKTGDEYVDRRCFSAPVKVNVRDRFRFPLSDVHTVRADETKRPADKAMGQNNNRRERTKGATTTSNERDTNNILTAVAALSPAHLAQCPLLSNRSQ